MKWMSVATFLGALGAAAVMSAPAARAIMPNPECVKDAAQEKVLCKSICQDNFAVAKDMCRNVDHACADACRAGRQACVAGPLGALQSCIDGCNATLSSARADCQSQFG